MDDLKNRLSKLENAINGLVKNFKKIEDVKKKKDLYEFSNQELMKWLKDNDVDFNENIKDTLVSIVWKNLNEWEWEYYYEEEPEEEEEEEESESLSDLTSDEDDDDGSDGTADVMYDDANGKEVVILVLYMGEFDIADILHTFITLISILSCSGSPREIISFSRNST